MERFGRPLRSRWARLEVSGPGACLPGESRYCPGPRTVPVRSMSARWGGVQKVSALCLAMRCEPGRFAVRPTFNQHSTSNSQDSIANYLFGGDSDPLREVRVREEQTFHSILEIVLIRGVMRFQTTA